MKRKKIYSYLTRKKLENSNTKDLIKLQKELKLDIQESLKFVNTYESNVKKYTSLYKHLSNEVEKINNFFLRVSKFIVSKEGFIFKDETFDIKFRSKVDEDEYLKKYKKLLNIFSNLVKLSGNISRPNPLFIQSWDDRQPRIELKINNNIDLNCYDQNYLHGGGVLHSFPIISKHQIEFENNYLDDIWAKRVKKNARKFYHRLHLAIKEHWGKDIHNDIKDFYKGYRGEVFTLTKKKFDHNTLKKYLKINKEETEDKLRQIELILRRKIKGKEKIENTGYVYVLSNEAYPNIFKIGSTYGLPEERAEELTGTGHLTPFKVKAKFKTQSAEFYEKITHKILHKYRVKQGREFFKLDLEKIKNCLTQILEITDRGKIRKTFDQLNRKIKI